MKGRNVAIVFWAALVVLVVVKMLMGLINFLMPLLIIAGLVALVSFMVKYGKPSSRNSNKRYTD